MGATTPDVREEHACVLVPGMLCTERFWSTSIERLGASTTVRTVVVDAPTIDSMVDQVLGLPYRRISLVGHSLGGIVALAATIRAPERIERLGLLGTSARPPRDEQHRGWEDMARRAREGGFRDITASDLLPVLLADAHQTPELRSIVIDMADGIGPDAFTRQLAAQHSRIDLRPHLARISRPTLVIAGEEDALAPVEAHEELAGGIADARLEVLPGVGHLASLEDPDRVAGLVEAWVGR